jgi:hypothetical protein
VSPLEFLGLPLFLLEVFCEPMNEGSDGAPLFMAPRICVKRSSSF